MLSSRDFEDLYGVTEERALNFWACNLHDVMGSERWAQISSSTGVYLASVLGHFCLQPVDRVEALSPDYSPGDTEFRQFADLTQIAEMMMRQLTSAKESALDGVSRRAHSAVRGILSEAKSEPDRKSVA